MAPSNSRPATVFSPIANALVVVKDNFWAVASVYLTTIIPSLVLSFFLAPKIKEVNLQNFWALIYVLPLALVSIFVECWAHMAILSALKNKTKIFASYIDSFKAAKVYFLTTLLLLLLTILGSVLIFPGIFLIYTYLLVPGLIFQTKSFNLTLSTIKKLILLNPRRFLIACTTFFIFLLIIFQASSFVDEHFPFWISFVPNLFLTLTAIPFFMAYSLELQKFLHNS